MKKHTVELLWLEAKDFEIGDYVFSEEGTCTYLICKKTRTLMHKHECIDVIYPFGYSGDGYAGDKWRKYLIAEIFGKRLVFRPELQYARFAEEK